MATGTSRSIAVYVLGTEGCGKSDLIHQLKSLSEGVMGSAPKKLPATSGQSISKLHLGSDVGRGVEVELRELGGSMMPTWESFLRARMERDARESGPVLALLFVVDASAPQNFVAARYALQQLTVSSEALCSVWPTAVVIQKHAAPGAVPSTEVACMLGISDVDSPHLSVFEVDSWNGLGVCDVLAWIKRQTSQ